MIKTDVVEPPHPIFATIDHQDDGSVIVKAHDNPITARLTRAEWEALTGEIED